MAMVASALLAAGFFAVTPPEAPVASLVDPEGGRLFMSSVEHLYRPYLEQWSEKDWARDVLANLKRWRFNALGPGPDPELRGKGLPYTHILWLAETMTTSDNPDDFIYPTRNHRACTGFPNVFSPNWKPRVMEAARRACGKFRDDRDLIGYFLDNELRWWGDGDFGNNDNGLFAAVAKIPSVHSARRALEAFVAERNTTVAAAPEPVRRAFVAEMCERFFRDCCEAVRAADPNHLILGVRFAGLGGPDEAWRACGKYCDVVSFNVYPWADLDRGTIAESGPGYNGKPLRPEVERRWRDAQKRPMLVSEWATVAFDSGLSCTAGAGQRFATQTERTAAAEMILREFASWPFLVGANWYRYLDSRARTVNDENCNYGLADSGGVAYPELTAMFARVNPQLNELRNASRGGKPASIPSRHLSATEAEAAGNPLEFTADGGTFVAGDWRLRTGGRHVFERAEWNGFDLGRITVSASADGLETRRIWIGSPLNAGVKVEADGAIVAHSAFERGKAKFRTVTRHRAKTGGRMVSSLVSVENCGGIPLRLHGFYFHLHSPLAHGGAAENLRVDSRKVWNPFAASAWIGTNGVYAGAMSSAPNARQFCYWYGRENRSEIYPDASFDFNRENPDAGLVVAPGEVWKADGRIWLEWRAGRGDAGDWRRIRDVAEHAANPLLARPPVKFPWKSAPGALQPLRGHVQGIAAAEDWIAASTADGIAILDWDGKLLHRTAARPHVGDLCHHNGLIYAAVAPEDTRRGKIAVYNRELKLLREAELSVNAPIDGIGHLDGMLYVGVNRGGKGPHRRCFIAKVDPFTMKVVEERTIELESEINYCLQNIAVCGGKIIATVYPAKGGKTGCLVLDKDLRLLQTLDFVAGHGFECAPVRFAGDAPRLLKGVSAYDWRKSCKPDSGVDPVLMLRMFEFDGKEMRHLDGER